MTTSVVSWWKSRADRDRGATAVEYAFMVMLIALAIIVAVAALGGQLSAFFGSVPDKIPTA
jgi:pilus assembly protein Flp/PilA